MITVGIIPSSCTPLSDGGDATVLMNQLLVTNPQMNSQSLHKTTRTSSYFDLHFPGGEMKIESSSEALQWSEPRQPDTRPVILSITQDS